MLSAALSSGIGAVLVLAGVPKVGDRARMTRAVRGYRLLPDSFAPVVGAGLPWLEIVLGVALVLGVAPRITGAVAAALFAAFFVALTVNLVRGRRDLDCGCFAFGAGAEEIAHIGWWHASRAAALAIAAAVVAGSPALSGVERAAGAGIGIFVVAVVAVGVYARSVMSLGRRPVDDYLSAAAVELRAVSSLSRY
ncbi:MauE/DoxX family redox-associated membrane protein [Nocardia noduli]|uniref:MauE/DoxX family redox-associated membrane protein n=1 Tax=Nocardia noduli TaxID=2815722 RepID=UPI001C215D88|nr:MauE/DoxX family redox-associated membrane protein [Nocardia noduli]